MKVTGFTFIRNAITYDYPIVEAIHSILPLCDEVVVAVGRSEDETLKLIQQIDPQKIIIVETIWDDSLREGGHVLATETNKAFQKITNDSDWCFYIQGDEIVHEKYLPTIKKAMLDNLLNEKVDGLLFHYLHFYGSYDYVITSSNFYKKEIRVIKNNKKIYSYKDAQGFRKNENEKLNVKLINAFIYHYGWVKEPKAMQQKQQHFNKLWHDDTWIEKNIIAANEFEYEEHISSLAKFDGTHPLVMQKRIAQKNWKFASNISFNKLSVKDTFKKWLYILLKIDLNYKNYNEI